MTASPDYILHNGEIQTQDPDFPRARAIALSGRRIVAVGDAEDIRSLAGKKTRMIDLDGRLVLPGFMDSHFHFYDWSLGRLDQDLAPVRSFGQMEDVLSKAALRQVPGSWIIGQGFNETDWPEKRLPTRDDLDRVTPAHPCIIWRCDLHLAVANSRALKAANISHTTPNPESGSIARDRSGRATGVLRETAINLVKQVIPPPGEDELARAMIDAQTELHSFGITALHDVRLKEEWAAPLIFRQWQRLEAEDKLRMRTWVSLPGERLSEAIGMGLTTGFGSDRLRIGHVKFFADGGMGARTAWVLEKYRDAEYGMRHMDPSELSDIIQQADRAGLAVLIHAVGDRAVREVVDGFEELAMWRRSADGISAIRPKVSHRIDHLQMIRPEDLERLARVGVAVGMQPSNMVLDFNLIDRCLGSNGKFTYTFRNVLDAGVPTLFNSDCPVSDPRPLRGIHALVTRQRPDGTPRDGWYPEQRISVDEAVRGYTATPAREYGRGHELGTLGPGRLGDMVVLDANIYESDPGLIPDTKVEMTFFDGQLVYERD